MNPFKHITPVIRSLSLTLILVAATVTGTVLIEDNNAMGANDFFDWKPAPTAVADQATANSLQAAFEDAIYNSIDEVKPLPEEIPAEVNPDTGNVITQINSEPQACSIFAHHNSGSTGCI